MLKVLVGYVKYIEFSHFVSFWLFLEVQKAKNVGVFILMLMLLLRLSYDFSYSWRVVPSI